MVVLKVFREKLLPSSKAQPDLQATQYNDLKAGLSHVCTQIAEMQDKKFPGFVVKLIY